MSSPSIFELIQRAVPRDRVADTIREYNAFHHAGDVQERKSHYTTMVNDYYDLVTDFYEFGWGQSFHFAPRSKGESFSASLARHEHYLAHRLHLAAGMTSLDVGCGVGGPMREIARFSGADVVGVNNNAYQIQRGEKHNEAARLSERCRFLKADFMKLPVPDGCFDAAYAIEATCHAPDKLALFSEIRRVLKPGASFAGYEWCMTDRYDASNAEHREIKRGIEEGDALPDIWSPEDVVGALKGAGFEVLEAKDLAPESDPETPWYLPLKAQWSLSGFKHTSAGRWVTHQTVNILERLKVAPQGSTAVSTMLNVGARALVRGGETGIFTPCYFFLAKNPG